MFTKCLMRCALCVLALTVLTGAASACDAPDSHDHPLLPRYQDACLLATRSSAFDLFALPLGQPEKIDGVWSTNPVQNLEGAITRLMYAAPAGRSALEVLRNYQQALQERGFEILYQCSGATCGRKDVLLNNVLFPREQRRSLAPGDRIYYAFTGSDQTHYLAARSSDSGAFVSIFVGTSNFKSSATSDLQGRAIVLADVIEPQQMEVRMVDAEEMARRIMETGRVALNNVSFEFGSAQLSAGSSGVVSEMARLLDTNPDLQVYVVGHTDNVGDYALNRKLSQQRAEAVVAALTASGIAASRLSAVGVASVAPVASNRSEQGRAENRRVELVER